MIPILKCISISIIAATLCACSEKPVEKWNPERSLCIRAKSNERGIVEFAIFSANGTPVYSNKATGASGYQNWSVEWLDNSRVALRSSDIGPQVWSQDKRGKCQRSLPNDAISPDGERIAYVFWNNSSPKITIAIGTRGEADSIHIISTKSTNIEITDFIDSLSWTEQDIIQIKDKDRRIHRLKVENDQIVMP